MLYPRFCIQIQELLKEELPTAADVELTESEGSFRVTMRTPADVLYPSVSLARFFEAYLQGVSVNEIIKRILSVYSAETLHPFCTASDFTDRREFAGGLGFRPASLRLYRGVLPILPHAVFHEMLFFFTAALPGSGSDPDDSIVTRETANRFKMSDEAMLKAAVSVSGERLPAFVYPLSVYLDRLAAGLPDAGRHVAGLAASSSGSSFLVLTNSASRFGASVILYPGVPEKICRRFGPYYLLPSSVHELLVLPEKSADNLSELKRLIRASNRELNDSLLVLSDELYRYDPQNGLHVC